MQSLYPIMSRIRIRNSGCEKLISIAGGGLRGLSCAMELLSNNFEVTIYETRQEIGNPVRSPGIIKNLNSEYISKCNAKLTDNGWGLRRDWLEKQLAKSVLDKGGKIILKTEAPEGSIDCRGGKSPAPGWPSTNNVDANLVVWNGGITIKTNLPNEFEVNKFEENKFCFEHSDGLIECWIIGDLPEAPQGWLELISGEHPNSTEMIWADESILEGKELATKTIQSLQGGI